MHLLSWHSVKEYNNTNLGLYARSCNVQVGAFYNSEREISGYAAYVFESDKHPFFLFTGAMTGYQNSAIMPFAAAGVKINKFRVSYTPKLGTINDTHLIHLAYEF